MLFSYVKKAALFAVVLAGIVVAPQASVFAGDWTGKESGEIAALITEIKGLSLDTVLDKSSKLSQEALAVWGKIKSCRVFTDLKLTDQGGQDFDGQAQVAALFFAKVTGALMVDFATNFFGKLDNFNEKKSSNDIKALLSQYIDQSLRGAGFGCVLKDEKWTCDGVSFGKDAIDMSDLLTSIADTMSKAQHILTSVNSGIKAHGLIFFDQKIKLSSSDQAFITVGDFINQTLKDIKHDISNALDVLCEVITKSLELNKEPLQIDADTMFIERCALATVVKMKEAEDQRRTAQQQINVIRSAQTRGAAIKLLSTRK